MYLFDINDECYCHPLPIYVIVRTYLIKQMKEVIENEEKIKYRNKRIF